MLKLKALIEKRNAELAKMDVLLQTSETEARAMTQEETQNFEACETEIRALDQTISAAEKREALERERTSENKKDTDVEQRAIDEANSFLAFVRGEQRALSAADNGNIIPNTISKKIIEKVKDLCPIYAMATVYNVGGDLTFPIFDEDSSAIKASYMEEFTELTEGSAKFKTVTLKSFIVGTLSKISKSLLNRTDFDLLPYIIQKVAQAIAEFLEKELLIGTSDKMEGAFQSKNIVTAGASTVVTVDDLIDLQDKVPDQLQGKACFIMHRDTRRALRKLKDSDGNLLMLKDITSPFGYTFLGKPIYTSESAPKMAAGAAAIAYGDMSGLYIKLSQGVTTQILNEKFATQYAIGVVGYVECDSKIVEPQKIAVLKMKAA